MFGFFGLLRSVVSQMGKSWRKQWCSWGGRWHQAALAKGWVRGPVSPWFCFQHRTAGVPTTILLCACICCPLEASTALWLVVRDPLSSMWAELSRQMLRRGMGRLVVVYNRKQWNLVPFGIDSCDLEI
ncbi:MAG: hypothetical protein MUQ67_02325, partial [Pirellulales bacterium]|nr:hypothetical protein [Pirellulales bacterium]